MRIFKFKFNVDDLGTENEIKIWKILDLLNNIGFHCKNKTIKIEDIKANTFGYAIIQVYRNQEIQKYLSHLDKHTDSVEGNLAAFDNFRLIAKKLLNS